ncbi:unnamed protein product [Clonostachys rosea f. rosea IK726]|jgi:hypothetical protein|uniref:Uncharacterized protein n=1 Tax=Clonostachys rosea f. rosea IK726 TaxID=1349383 RepID=A0ACA9TCP4_BIOOC|nr:unnamed protein product [Clonostachys rosea f. rosea IK726]
MAGGRRKQRYAASNLDPSWNVQDEMPGERSQFFIPAEAAAEGPDQAIDAQSPTISRQATPHSDAFSPPRATPAQDQQPITQQLQSQSQSPSHLEVLELPVTQGSTPSRHSRDGEESVSTVSSSAPSRSAKGKKKRYVTEHSADWVEEDLVYPAGPSLGPYPQQTLAAMPHQPQQMPPSSSIVAQPPDLTTPSSMATTSPALSIFRGGGHQTNSPGQDAPAIQPGAPSASSPASPFAGVGQPSAHQAQQAPDNHLGVIIEEQQQQTGPPEPPPPPQPHPQALPAQAKRKGWSRLLRRG